ncbi:hypothetical protein NQ318_000413 [Aromia moschata]|uniref:Engulfment and cell motility protein 1 n=1 Tax=Aromia moschata TaxID=1265417 RepID=A0AAV8YTZ8_9CUCU|nr:hypothetical protein NQ318_000413 [Aromia moschata]
MCSSVGNMSNIAKISVEKHESKEQFLYDLDKTKTLCELVRDICKEAGIPESRVYGLKLIQTKENPFVNTYISEKTYKDIQHSDCLKIAFSIEYLLNMRILPHINEDQSNIEKAIAVDDLLKLSVDPVFIDEIVKNESYKKFIDVYIKGQSKDNELLALLITICHLFQKGCIKDTSQNILKKTISIVKNPGNTIEHIKYALSILHKILVLREMVFIPWKEEIIRGVPITELTPYIWSENSKSVQYGILLLINTIIRLCKGDKKLQLIKEMNLRQNRDNIYKYVILPGNLDRNTEHELYVLQTYLLSLYKEALNSEVSLDDSNLVTREEFELCEEDVRRLTVLMDFDETDNYPNRSISTENLLMYKYNLDERLSLASILSDKSQSLSRKSSTLSMRKTSETIIDDYKINYLTLEALRHYKKNHYKIFYQSQIEERIYEPGIFVTSERVIKMLAKLLHINVDPPDSKSVSYQPIIFNCSLKNALHFGIIRPNNVVMHALEKQVKMVLEKRPIDFKELTEEMTEVNFDVVMKQWQKEKDDELKNAPKNAPVHPRTEKDFLVQNEENLYNNRINCLKRGGNFPKKTQGTFFAQLSKNERELHIYDVKNPKTNDMNMQQKNNYIRYNSCSYRKELCTMSSLAFSIIINHSENQVNFIAKDEKTACYWTDAFHLLTGNNSRSDYYKRELDDLVEMDVMLQILELQNVRIPKHAPPIPPPPLEVKPPVPPKSEILIRNLKRRTNCP